MIVPARPSSNRRSTRSAPASKLATIGSRLARASPPTTSRSGSRRSVPRPALGRSSGTSARSRADTEPSTVARSPRPSRRPSSSRGRSSTAARTLIVAPGSARPSATALSRRSGKPSSARTARPRSSAANVPAPSASPTARTPSNRSASEAVTSWRVRNSASRRPDAEPARPRTVGTSWSSANPTGPSLASRRPPPLHCHDPVPRTATPRTRVDTAVASIRSASIPKAAWSASIGQPPTVRTGAVSVPRPRHPPVAHDASPSSASGSFPRTARASAIRMAEGVSRNGTVTPVSVTSVLVSAVASSRPLATGSRHDPLTSAATITWPATRSWPRARANSAPSAMSRLRSAIGPSNGTRPSRDTVPTGQRPRIDTASSPALVSRASPRTSPGVTRSNGGGSRACSSPSATRASLPPASMTADATTVPSGPSARNWSSESRPRSHRMTAGERVVQRPPADDELVRGDRRRHPDLSRPPEGNLGLRACRDAPEHSPACRGRRLGHDGIQVGPLESGLRGEDPAFLETPLGRGREPHRGELERRREVAARDTDVETARPEEDAAERDVTEADRRGGGRRPPLCAGPEARLTGPL